MQRYKRHITNAAAFNIVTDTISCPSPENRPIESRNRCSNVQCRRKPMHIYISLRFRGSSKKQCLLCWCLLQAIQAAIACHTNSTAGRQNICTTKLCWHAKSTKKSICTIKDKLLCYVQQICWNWPECAKHCVSVYKRFHSNTLT